MTADVAVAVLDGHDVVEELASRTGVRVVATRPDDHLDVAAGLGRDVGLVVGLASVPWPSHADLHAEGSASLPAYTGVVSWHGLPWLLDRLAEAVRPGAARAAHVLVTAPDPGPTTDPGDLGFLREVAAGITERAAASSVSVAWRGESRTPTAVTALRSVVEAHGRRDVVECPVAPGTGADPALLATADELGCRLVCVDLGRETHVGALERVVRTVLAHEGVA